MIAMFSLGDVVVPAHHDKPDLKMTVTEVRFSRPGDTPTYECSWFTNGDVKRSLFCEWELAAFEA